MNALFISYLWRNPYCFFSGIIIVVISVCFHEFCHAFAALKCGDDTAAERGHLTFNPFRQMGIISLLMLAILGIAWGQVPVDHKKMRHKYDPVLVALAGPLSNVLLGVIFLVLTYIVASCGSGKSDFAMQMLFYGGNINFVLAMINLLPIPGFDGFAVTAFILPKIFSTSSEFIRGFFVSVALVLFVFLGRIFELANVLSIYVLTLVDTLVKWIR